MHSVAFSPLLDQLIEALRCLPGVGPKKAKKLWKELGAETVDELETRWSACRRLLPTLPLERDPVFTRDADKQAALWRVRKALCWR